MPEDRSDRRRRETFSREALPHLDQVYGAALYLARDPELAQDLVQETFLRAWRFFHQFRPGTNCQAWLLTILHNTFRNRYRASRRERGHIDIGDPLVESEASRPEEESSNPEALVLGNLLDDELSAALDGLSQEFRAAVVLVDLQELSYEEAARALDCPIGTVRSRLSRARTMLRNRLESHARGRGT